MQYHGTLSILIGPRTYSSAVIFAAPFKHYHLATMIGEETGEPLVFYGDDYDFDLPATHLQAQVSHKRFTLLGGATTAAASCRTPWSVRPAKAKPRVVMPSSTRP